ncbi:MAG: molybdopterin-dependent oxidoreductase, partial [Dehalococcoidia bacterium]|nr:molybdopterin-dependent oxidoreductase [Dehalococcoidia bacterium]
GTIRKIATDLAQEARIGSTIELEGREYPYRPAGVYGYRGLAGHMDGGANIMALRMINMLIGSFNVPGGHAGVPLFPGVAPWYRPTLHPTSGFWIKPGPDGTIFPMPSQLHPPVPFSFPPNSSHLIEWFPVGMDSPQVSLLTMAEPEKFHLPVVPDTMIIWHTNPLVTVPATDKVEQLLKRMKFIVSINIHHDESTEFADVILPDRTYLERSVAWPFAESPYVAGWQYAQAVIEPLYNTKDATDTLVELAERAGFLPELNSMLNFMLWAVPPHELRPDQKYTSEEIWDRQLKSVCGDEYGVEWFSRHGSLARRWKAEELYCPNDTAAGHTRYPFYFEWVKKQGDELQRNLKANGLDWWDTSDYVTLPLWKTTKLHQEPPQYDMYAMIWKAAYINFAETVDIPWIAEIALLDPHQGSLLMNTETAKAKGIEDGDTVLIK